jgi:hypothetical protein
MTAITHSVRRRPLRSVVGGSVALVILAIAALLFAQHVNAASKDGGDQTAPATSSSVSPGTPSDVQVSGKTGHYSARDRTDEVCTTSTSYVNMPGAHIGFTLGGSTAQSVLVLFSGEWFNNDRALARVVVDGVVQSGPGDDASPISLDSGNDAGTSIDQSNGFNFITDSLAPGHHALDIQWASVGGASICVDERSTIVLRP